MSFHLGLRSSLTQYGTLDNEQWLLDDRGREGEGERNL